MSDRRILYCHCAYSRVVPSAVKEAVLKGLIASETAFEAVPDLCEMSARRDPALERLVAGDGEIKIAACYPRAVKWLFAAAGTPLPEAGVCVANMREDSASEVLAALWSPSVDHAASGTDRSAEGQAEVLDGNPGSDGEPHSERPGDDVESGSAAGRAGSRHSPER